LLSLKLLFTISILTFSYGFAQTITLLSDKNKGVKEAFIYSNEHPRGAISDQKGKVDISEFGENEILTIQHVQFDNLRIKKSEIKNDTILLKQKANSLPTVYYDYPLRYNVSEKDEAGQIEKIDREIIRLENPATSADMLQNTGSILVQKSQGAGGSPIIRGFEANKLLLVIDGVRMNNAIYRSGHLQNAITIDNGALDHTEIIFGPSSSLYGSDALGGVIHFHTRDPNISGEDTLYFEGGTNLRFNSNNRSVTGHFDFSFGRKKWGYLSSISANKFGDIIMGTNRSFHNDSAFGLHPELVVQVESGDTVVTNLQPSVQAFSGYTQFDILQKFVYESNAHLKYTLNFQYSTSSIVNRYDKLTEYRNGTLRYAEWYYGPQKRLFGQFKADFSKSPNNPKNKMFHSGVFSLAYQKTDEDRISRQFQSDSREVKEEDVHVFSLNTDFNRIFTKNRILFYGLEVQHNLVYSSAYQKNIQSSLESNAQTRYPHLSNYLSSGAYLEYKQKFKNNSMLTAGTRFSFIAANSKFEDTTFLSLPFDEVNLLAAAPSANIGYVLNPDSLSQLKFLATTGFRAPNIDDYGKVFEKSGNTVVPNNELKPEYATGLDFTFSRTFGKDFLTIGGSAYATYLFNAMVQRDFTLNGQDSIYYQGDMTKIQAIVNTDNAIIYGTSVYLKMNLTAQLKFHYSHNFTKGIDLAADTPFEHIPPQFGKIAFTYAGEKVNTALYTFYNFRKKLSDYAPGGDNIELSPSQAGTSPWWTLNYRFGYNFYQDLTVQLAVENILDMQYRQFASGISAPGRNFMLSLKADF
jgi:hemoglobin/transferrin/lactoferrin receptor protein